MAPPRTGYRNLIGLLTLLAAACASGPSQTLSNEGATTSVATSQATASTSTTAPTTSSAPTTEASGSNTVTDRGEPADSTETTTQMTDLDVLPVREGPVEQTTNAVPHKQLDVQQNPALDAALRRRAFSIPGVERRQSFSPGAEALWLSEDLDLAQSGLLASGREFAHVHADGSLHLWLPVERAIEVEEKKWGQLHPWVDRGGFWDGTVMVFTPESPDDVEVAVRLIVDAYNFMTGASFDPVAAS